MLRWFSTDGSPLPMGQVYIAEEDAYNFALYSRQAERVQLLLFGDADLAKPLLEFEFDPLVNKWNRVWCCRIPKRRAPAARYYAYRVWGPAKTSTGVLNAFDPDKLLLDPYATEVFFPPTFDRDAARRLGSNMGRAPLAVLNNGSRPFEWGAARAPRHGHDAVIYEMHVRGFTRSVTSGLPQARRGTYLGVIDKVPYLKELGVTIVELMPVFQYDPHRDYWGYMPINFFAPHQQYASEARHARDEFRAMVRALHEAGIEVLLDVVYNHTGENDHRGPVYSFKGIDNATYYLATRDPEKPYVNYSGCGNTLRCGEPFVRTMIIDSLRHWAEEMHVDGFRFDLASILARDSEGGAGTHDSPTISAIRSDPVLRTRHLIAEPWDAGGLYQVGANFPGLGWHQWNSHFRDDCKRFARGEAGLVPAVMRRMYGSDDLFPDDTRLALRPFLSINYIASHDGFTMYDLTSYTRKRNEANGHDNTDGPAEEFSDNCGHEGDEGAPEVVLRRRERRVKFFFLMLMTANGVPMFRAGDEFMQTQRGNSNPYNQDNDTTWLDWGLLKRHEGVFRFVKRMIAFRKAHPSICRSRYWRGDVAWLGPGGELDLGPESRCFGFHLHGAGERDCDIVVMLNGGAEGVRFALPPGDWRRAADSGLESPRDALEPGREEAARGAYELGGNAGAVFMQ